MKLTYAVVFEQTPNNYGAYAPDVPGCISTTGESSRRKERARRRAAGRACGRRR